MKPLVILNPRSQGGKTARQAEELMRVVRRYLGEVDEVHTERGRHATEIAAQAHADGRQIVVAVGGDGTIHEVVNGLMQAREGDHADAGPALGIVGQGTGGDFRRTLGLEHRLDRYCQAIAAGVTRPADVGRFSYRSDGGESRTAYFNNILSVGMGGLVDRYVANDSQRFGGTVAYFMASLRALVEIDLGVLRCTVTSGESVREVELKSRMLAICNGRFFGGGMEVAPMASLDDGVFHVVSLGGGPKLRYVLSSMSIYSGEHVHKPDVEVFTCSSIDVELANTGIRERFPLDVDGEPLGTLPISVQVVPNALRVFAP